MEAKAIARYIRVSPQKARLVADNIKGRPVEEAMNILKFTPKKAAQLIGKVLHSAVANAEQISGVDIDTLPDDVARIEKYDITTGWVSTPS